MGQTDVSVQRKRRLLFVLPKTTEFGGLERHLMELLRRLPQRELNVNILCFEQDHITAHLRREGHQEVVVNCEKEPLSLWDWRRAVRQTHPDIVVFCYSWIEAFPWQAPVAAWLAGVRKRYSIQHLIPETPPPSVRGYSPRNIARRLVGRRARQILRVSVSGHLSKRNICVSEAVRSALISNYRFPIGKTRTIRNGVSASRFAPSQAQGALLRARLGIAPEDFLLVCAARLAEAKGIDIVLQAMCRVLSNGTRCKCIIIGDGPLRGELLQMAASLGLSHCVMFEGFQPDVRPYLQAASAFILTSHLEGLPLSVLEAMACGLPCIVSDVGGTSEAVLNHITGLIVPDGSAKEAAQAIEYLASHPEERARMSHQARARVCQDFDVEHAMEALKEVILA